MKKYSIYALMSAIALAGAIGFSSCSSKEEITAEVNPGYNPTTGDVPVNFVFNVSTNSQGSTRMSAANVQEGAGVAFRGIQNAKLFSFKATSDGAHIANSTATKDRVYDLDMLIEEGELQADGKPASHRVLEMSLPTGTNTLMMWGRAYRKPQACGDLDAMYGGIEFSPNENLANASFKLKPCVPINSSEVGNEALAQYERLIEKVLKDVIQAKVTVTRTLNERSITDKELAWQDYVDFANNGTLTAKAKDPSTYIDESHCYNMSALGQILADLFVKFNTFNNNVPGQEELRNGEGKIIADLMGDIYTVMQKVIHANATTVEELAAQDVASGVVNQLTKYFSTTASGEVYTLSWLGVSTVKTNSGLATTAYDKISNSSDLNKFPSGIFHLPPGATIMQYVAVKAKDSPETGYDIVNEYKYMDNVPTYAMGGGTTTTFNPANYMYPAELCYFGNSPIRVSDDTHAVGDYPDGVTNWDKDTEWDANIHNNTVAWTKNYHVLTSTRSVAMQENINYGTSMLVTTVKYGAPSLDDNNQGLHPTEQPKSINVSEGTPFKLTGILVGGAVKEVGWDYTAKTNEANFSCMVYDNQLENAQKSIPAYGSNTATTPTYTLVWDNWDSAQKLKDQRKVFVALEFLNDAQDFWGKNNLIRKGASFYIIGELDPENGTYNTSKPGEGATDEEKAEYYAKGIDWPEKYALPPYDESGNTIKERRVFIQDYKTIANFTLGPNALKNALVSVPDLRQSQISLGLSVDLQWQSGLTYDMTIGR